MLMPWCVSFIISKASGLAWGRLMVSLDVAPAAELAEVSIRFAAGIKLLEILHQKIREK